MAARVTHRWQTAVLSVAFVTIVAACGTGAALPPAPSEPGEATGTDVAATRAALASALGAVGLQLSDPQVPHRPGEGPLLAAARRAVFQVVLPDDPVHGFVSVYLLKDEIAATAAARDQAAYIASGPGRVQFVPDTRFVIRQLGPTVVFFAWSPVNSPDSRTADIQKALETVGTGIPVPL